MAIKSAETKNLYRNHKQNTKKVIWGLGNINKMQKLEQWYMKAKVHNKNKDLLEPLTAL